MNEITPPVQSLKYLILATLAATILAAIILISFILPAEYGIDPTGLGESMGLTVLSEQANQPVNATAGISCDNPVEQVAKSSQWTDSVKITVPPKDGLEYKFHLQKNAKLEFSWETDGSKLYFDFHGEPSGDKTGYFKSFKESTDTQSSGTLEAPFEGSHGWYWENKTRSPVTVILNTRGDYQILGLM